MVACSGGSGAPVQGPTRTLARIDAGEGGVRDIEITREDDTSTAWLDAPADEVWRHLAEVYDEMGFQAGDLSTFNPGSRRIGVANARRSRIAGERPSTFLQCGHSLAADKADAGQTVVTLDTWLEPHEGGTWVRTRLHALARSIGTSATPATCSSRGRLERRIVESLQRRMTTGSR
jgi:hypothetical protein